MRFRIILLYAATAGIVSLAVPTCASAEAVRAEPRGFIYGVGVGLNQELYQDYRRRVVPIPIVGYRGERLSVYGPFISYDVFKQEQLTFSLRLAPRFAGVDESDSPVFAGMEKRRTSMDVGAGIQLNQQNWRYELSLLADALNNSNGYEISSAISYRYQAGPFFFEPKLSLYHSDSKLVDYYYGVRPEEATEQRPAYQAGSVINYGTGLSVATPIFAGGMTRLGLEHRWYGDSIADSPLTDRRRGFQLFFSYSRFF